jgi:hypothetical protein
VLPVSTTISQNFEKPDSEIIFKEAQRAPLFPVLLNTPVKYFPLIDHLFAALRSSSTRRRYHIHIPGQRYHEAHGERFQELYRKPASESKKIFEVQKHYAQEVGSDETRKGN